MVGRARARLEWIEAQLAHSRRVVVDAGWKVAIGDRVGAAVAKSPQWRLRKADIERIHDETERLRQDLLDSNGRADTSSHQLFTLTAAFEDLNGQLERKLAIAEEYQARTDENQARTDEYQARTDEHRLRTEELLGLELPSRIAALSVEHGRLFEMRDGQLWAAQQEINATRAELANLKHIVTDWLWTANAPLARQPSISVIMPTAFPARLGYLRSAIESVLHQTYQTWELIVLDDGDVPFLDPSPEWWPSDSRVRLVRGEGRSEGRARNTARGLATGEIIAYLDDDCRWFPWWLHAVASAFASDPDLGLVHGVRVVEGSLVTPPWTHAQFLDPLSLHVGNPVDTNVMAHRANLADSEWPDISSCADYDTVIRLSQHRSRFLPVPAATYAVTSPFRAWAPERASINELNFRTVQSRARRARPLRIVAHNGLYPLLSETYIGDELEALRRQDIDIVLSRNTAASVESQSRVDAPLFESLGRAISSHDPDLVLMHWAGVGLEARAEVAAAGVPYAIRLHSFDGGLRMSDLINEWCVGVWAFPHFQRDHRLVFDLDTLIIDPGSLGAEHRDRRVLSLSAGLPKKDFGGLMAAMALLPELPFEVTMATTNGFESLPTEVRKMIAEHGVNGSVIENLPFIDGQHAVRSAGALIYSLAADEHIGQPRSILEAAIAGTPMVLPDDPAVRAIVGLTAHFFERGSTSAMAAAIEEALDHPRSWDERVALSERVIARHAGARVFEAWADSITSAVVMWQRDSRSDRIGANLRWWWPN
jgi:glycosyltransferase involved in cell wall biosynthesis